MLFLTFALYPPSEPILAQYEQLRTKVRAQYVLVLYTRHPSTESSDAVTSNPFMDRSRFLQKVVPWALFWLLPSAST